METISGSGSTNKIVYSEKSKEKKVLMLILANDGGKDNIYTKLQEVKRMYIHSKSNIEAYFYKADPTLEKDYKISGDTIYVKTEEKYPELWKKFWLVLKAFEHRFDEFDYICRPNLSTFIILDNYLEHLETLPKTNCCSGVIHYGGQPIPFPAGYLFTLSPDVAKKLIYNNDIIPNNEGIDDRCIGFILDKLGIPIISNNYVDISNTSIDYNSIVEKINKDKLYIVRIRHFLESHSNKFGIDIPDRLQNDMFFHDKLLKEFYSDNTYLKMIRPESLSLLNNGYKETVPFPHIIIDDFLKEDFLEKVLAEVKLLDSNNAYYKATYNFDKLEYNKFAFKDNIGTNTMELFKYLNSDEFIKCIESLTGIYGIVRNNLSLAGAGVHRIHKDGCLAVHTDFNTYTHPVLGKLDRRVNILIYLNPNWQESYKGHLWLCDSKEPLKKILPILNRCVIFNTTSQSHHGHPERLCVPNDSIYRESIASYYYTKNINDPYDFEGNLHHAGAIVSTQFPYNF
jgi:Rps23 Pro-64 3,4-dihydroxylase Tpa1-like proline 4-hydroxylase